MTSPSIMFIAGDPSGDQHAAPIVKNLVSQYPGARLWGIGGPSMQALGFKSILPFEPFNKMGFLEVIKHIGFFLNAKSYLISKMKETRPDLLVCVDYPGFNMPMMKAARRLNIPVLWYIAPMVWAWKKKRARILAENANHIACIFPFEVKYFSPYTNRVSFAGNPLVEMFEKEGWGKEKTYKDEKNLALIPGSRIQEIEKMLQPMIETYHLLKKRVPNLKVVISKCKPLPDDLFARAIKDGIPLSNEPLREMLNRCDLAIITSGTATLEAALMGVPHVIAYKTSPVTYKIFKQFIKIPYIGLPNIIAGSQIVPECIQNDVNAEMIASELAPFLTDRSYYLNAVEKLKKLRVELGGSRPSKTVCDLIKEILKI